MIEALVRSDFEAQPEAVEIKTSIIAPIRRVSGAKPIGKRAPLNVNRCLAQPGFVLHSYPYKETSLILDVFSRDYGRVSLVAKGAKRPHSQLRSVLQSFQPLILGWSGKTEVRTLISAEWVGGMLPLEKSGLLCGFYLNELMLKFLVKDAPNPALFRHYVSTLSQLAHNEPAQIVLRKFELLLLTESGLIGELSICTSTKQRLLPSLYYVLEPEKGARPARVEDEIPKVLGKTLLDMCNEDYSDPTTQLQSKMLMRFLLAHHLHGITLNTRQILIDLQRL